MAAKRAFRRHKPDNVFGLGVCLPIGLLIIGVLDLPLSPAVTDHLRI